MIFFLDKYGLWLCCFFLLFPLLLFAEGTRQLRPDYAPVDKAAAYLTIRSNSMASWNADSARKLYIHISDTSEVIYYGFGHVTSSSIELNQDITATSCWKDSIEYRIKDPLGNVVVNSLVPVSGQGFIGDSSLIAYKKAVNGPRQLVGDSGYDALSFQPQKTGDYSIEFRDPVNGGGKRVFQLFDITVGSEAGKPLPGRLWAHLWRLITYGQGQEPDKIDPFEGKLYTYSSDQVVTEITFKDFRPWEFSVFCNSYGVDTSGTVRENRQSSDDSPLFLPEYKVFLQPPDTTAYPTGELSCVKALSTVHQCNTDDYCINLETSRDGYANVFLDIDKDGLYSPYGKDVMFDAVEVNKDVVNCVNWDGRDNEGNVINKNDTIPVYAYMIAGITHLPMDDVERCGGLDIRLIRPEKDCFGGDLDSVLMYWDDRKIGGSSNLEGCLDFCRSWEVNEKTNNTWWYIINERTLSHFVKRDTALLVQLDSTNNLDGYYKDGDTVLLNVFFRNDQYSATDLLDTLQVNSNNSSLYQLNLEGADTIPINAYTGLLKVYYTLENDASSPVFDLDFDVYLQNDYCTRLEQVNRQGILKTETTARNLSCFESGDGRIVFKNTRGGSGAYRYSVDGGSSWSNDSVFNDLAAGVYELCVGDVNNPANILNADTITLDQPAEVISVISNEGSPVDSMISFCPDENKSLSGGQSVNADSIDWFMPDGTMLEGFSSIVADEAGLYKMKVYDVNDCPDSMSVEVKLPEYPDVQFSETNTLRAYKGEVADYSLVPEQDHHYRWSIPGYGEIKGNQEGAEITVSWYDTVTQNAFILVQATDTLTGCSTIDTLEVEIYAVPELQIDDVYILNDESCQGSADGRISTVIFGGEERLDVCLHKDGVQILDTFLMAGQPASLTLKGLSASQYKLVVANQGIVDPDSVSFDVEVADKSYQKDYTSIKCEGDTACMKIIASTPPVVLWRNDAGDSVGTGASFCTQIPGNYSAEIAINDVCREEESFSISPPDSLDINISGTKRPYCKDLCDGVVDVHVHKGNLNKLYGYEINKDSLWELDIIQPRMKNLCAGIYVVEGMNADGCVDADTVRLMNKKEICLEIPNAFTPNDDGVNDTWELTVLKKLYPKIEVFIYDRWGQLIFKSPKGYPDAWDGVSNGRPLPTDAYHYIIYLNDPDNKVETGQVNLIR